MTTVDRVIWRFLALDLLLLEAERRLPAPPIVPAFCRVTERPGKETAS